MAAVGRSLSPRFFGRFLILGMADKNIFRLSTTSIQKSAEATAKGVQLLNTKVSPIQSQLLMMKDRFNQVQSLLIRTNVIVSSIDSKF